MTNQENKDFETGCCKRFNPEPWDDNVMDFSDRLFIKDRVRSFFHIPLNFGQVMTRNVTKMEEAGACPEDGLVLTDETSLWGADVYFKVTKDIQGANMVKGVPGTFVTKVFEGPYKNIGKWAKEMKAFVAKKNKKMKKMLFYYTTCPKCAKAYGKNYVVLLAQV